VAQNHESVSLDLRRAFPIQEDLDIVSKSNYIANFFYYQIFTRSGENAKDDAVDIINEIAVIPDPYITSPVLVAKRMKILALMFHYFGCSNALSENLGTIADRLFEAAARYTTTNDQLVSCIDGLECMILEAIFAHIESHCKVDENFRAPQRPDDCAIVEQLIQSMEVAARLTSDLLTSKSAEQGQTKSLTKRGSKIYKEASCCGCEK
jgi:hypothetical protein